MPTRATPPAILATVAAFMPDPGVSWLFVVAGVPASS